MVFMKKIIKKQDWFAKKFMKIQDSMFISAFMLKKIRWAAHFQTYKVSRFNSCSQNLTPNFRSGFKDFSNSLEQFLSVLFVKTVEIAFFPS